MKLPSAIGAKGAEAESRDEPDPDRNCAAGDHQPDDVARGGADGLADAELAGALRDGERHEAVDAHHREKRAERAEAARERRAHLRGNERDRDRVGHLPDIDESGRVEPGHLGAQGLRRARGVRRSHEYDDVPLRTLQIGRVNERPDRFANRPVLAVAHHAYHFSTVHASAERVPVPELPRRCLVHDHHTRERPFGRPR